MLAEMSLFAVQTEAEAQRFRDLGARAQTAQVTGSIKFDLTIDPQLLLRAAELRGQWRAQERPVWIAASTHEGEARWCWRPIVSCWRAIPMPC
jgi:3-deoxy-D-manno-octulosonic-acid transferase